MDSVNFIKRSEEAFKNRIDFDLRDLNGKLVLDVGCRCRRFAEIDANYGGKVLDFDLSYSIDVAFENIGSNENFHLVQADIFNLPFKLRFPKLNIRFDYLLKLVQRIDAIILERIITKRYFQEVSLYLKKI